MHASSSMSYHIHAHATIISMNLNYVYLKLTKRRARLNPKVLTQSVDKRTSGARYRRDFSPQNFTFLISRHSLPMAHKGFRGPPDRKYLSCEYQRPTVFSISVLPFPWGKTMAQNRGKKARSKNAGGLAQARQARTIDALMEFDQFNKTVLPQLKKMVLENWPPERIRKHFAPMIQAKVIEKAFSGDFRAQKDVLDRHEGMAVQRVEQKTIHQRMSKQELAALALQKLIDAGLIVDVTSEVIPESNEED